MTVAQAYKEGVRTLEGAGVSCARANAGWALQAVTGEQRLLLPICMREMEAAEAERWQEMLLRMAQGEPLQYVLGVQEFMGREFCVDARVLIPREDTATLVNNVLLRMGEGKKRVLDIGTGSGAIAVTIALERPQSVVTAVDISVQALKAARANARRLGANVRFIQSDLFAALEGERFDVIVSNPPYIRSGDIASLEREVQREPHGALDGGEDGLCFYRAIILRAPWHLTDGGMLCFEVGYGQATDVVSLMKKRGFVNTGMDKDLGGVERAVWGTWPCVDGIK